MGGMREKRKAQRVLVGKLKIGDFTKDAGLVERIILKWLC
jgi:hypothetical protein